MAASSLQQQLADLTPRQQRILVVLGVILVLAGYYYVFGASLWKRYDQAVAESKRLSEEREDYERKRRDYRRTVAQRDELAKRQKDLLQILPKKSEIPTLLEQLQAQNEMAGLEVKSFERKPEVVLANYARIPVAMEISGTYHQIARFFHLVSKLKRIVNVGNMSFEKPTVTDKGIMLTLRTEAATFRFLEAGEKPGRSPVVRAALPGRPAPPPPGTAQAAAAAAKAASALAANPLRESDFIESESNRDPFRQGIDLFAVKKIARGSRGGRKILLEKYALEELKLIAVVSGIPDARAMLRVPGGVGYVVHKGDYVSKNEARVVQIVGDRVIVSVETQDDQGRVITSERVLALQPEPAANERAAPTVRQ